MAADTGFSSPIQFDWTIRGVNKLDKVFSPECIIEGSSWKVLVGKHLFDTKQYLSVYLVRATKNGTSHAARARFTLLTFDDSPVGTKTKKFAPVVFNDVTPQWGFCNYLEWGELLDDHNKYLKGDTIKFRVNIEADTNNVDCKSILKSEKLAQFPDRNGVVRRLLTITNIENLMAVESTYFMLRDQDWSLTVFKETNDQSYLGVRLRLKPSSSVGCKVEMTVKLMSLKKGLTKSSSGICQKPDRQCLIDEKLIPWNQLVIPENGYVQNDKITLEVEVKADQHPTAKKRTSMDTQTQPQTKLIKLECRICEKDIDHENTSSIPCGHVFCTPCITAAINRQRIFPIDACKAKVPKANGLRRIYLPM